MSEKQFLAGAAKVDVTPPLGTFINGDFVPHYAQYIHDPLHARALVFQQGDVLTAFVVIDICVVPFDMVKTIKAGVQTQTGILPENVLVSATHTHAGGSVAQVYLGAADMQYAAKLPALVVKAVVKAKQNLRPAKISWGGVDVPEHVLTRRYAMKPGYDVGNPVFGTNDKVKTNPFLGEKLISHGVGAVDPEVGFLAVKGTDDQWISVLASYSLHYVGDWSNGTITADYFAVFAENLKARLGAGDDFVGIMSNGTSGNINIWEFLNPERYPSGEFEKSKMIGEDIAGRVAAQLDNLQWKTESTLGAAYADLSLPMRKPSAQELEDAKEIVINTNYENLEITHIKGLKELYAREQIMLADLPNNMPLAIQAIKIGNGVIGAIGAEMFAETGLWLKEQSPIKNYFTIGLANGNAGYVPPQHEFENGGYETWRGRTSMLVENAEGIIREELLGLIKAVVE